MSEANSDDQRDEEFLRAFEADYPRWAKENAELVAGFRTLPRDSLEFLLKWAMMRLDGALAFVRKQNDLLEKYRSELLPAAQDKGMVDGINLGKLVLLRNADAIIAYSVTREALAKGRKTGADARKSRAATTREALVKAIADLFDSPDKPGWAWSNNRIADFLEPSFKYTKGTILQVVKTEAAKHRRRRKEKQARRFPIR